MYNWLPVLGLRVVVLEPLGVLDALSSSDSFLGKLFKLPKPKRQPISRVQEIIDLVYMGTLKSK